MLFRSGEGSQSLSRSLSILTWRVIKASVWVGLEVPGQGCSWLVLPLGLWSSIFSLNLLDAWNLSHTSEEFFHQWTRDRVHDIGG